MESNDMINRVLTALDGSKNSQIAAEYAFWLSNKFDSELAGLHVVDPRMVDLFVEPEFGEELGLSVSEDTSEKVILALRKIGKVILKRFEQEAQQRGFEITTKLGEGYIPEEIVEYSKNFDLLVIGHRGRDDKKLPANLLLGSVAERVVVGAELPVLIAVQPVDQLEEILVAYDGSEASRGALLMAEHLAKGTGAKLRALVVVHDESAKKAARVLIEEGEKFLREYWERDVFSVKEGAISDTLMDASIKSKSLLVLGAYGYKNPDQNVLGSTTTKIIRETNRSVLVYRPTFANVKQHAKSLERVKH
jgi:nucleotide-binding universal stress UspA family protein